MRGTVGRLYQGNRTSTHYLPFFIIKQAAYCKPTISADCALTHCSVGAANNAMGASQNIGKDDLLSEQQRGLGLMILCNFYENIG